MVTWYTLKKVDLHLWCCTLGDKVGFQSVKSESQVKHIIAGQFVHFRAHSWASMGGGQVRYSGGGQGKSIKYTLIALLIHLLLPLGSSAAVYQCIVNSLYLFNIHASIDKHLVQNYLRLPLYVKLCRLRWMARMFGALKHILVVCQTILYRQLTLKQWHCILYTCKQ